MDSKLRETINIQYGMLLKHYREEKGLTQQQLSDQSFVSKSHIGNAETGESGLSLPALTSVTEVLGITPNDIAIPIDELRKLDNSIIGQYTDEDLMQLEALLIAMLDMLKVIRKRSQAADDKKNND